MKAYNVAYRRGNKQWRSLVVRVEERQQSIHARSPVRCKVCSPTIDTYISVDSTFDDRNRFFSLLLHFTKISLTT